MEEEQIEYRYVFLSDEELSENMNMSLQTIKKYHKSLIEKGYLDIVEIDGKKVKRYNLSKLNEEV
jgi:biotin operon repressor